MEGKKHQVFGSSTVKLNMKITVLLFQPDREADPALADALGAAGIRVCRKKGLSGMHHQLSSQQFDAILVDGAVLARYGFSPSRHLWNSRSAHTIMVFSVCSGECLIETYGIPQEESGSADRKDKDVILSRIKAVVTAALSRGPRAGTQEAPTAGSVQSVGAVRSAGAVPSGTGLPIPIPDIPLQEKPARLLSALVQAGSSGADLADIALKLWGTVVPDRKKDIQIYVTRVRNALDESFPQRYRIRRAGTHYILVDTAV